MLLMKKLIFFFINVSESRYYLQNITFIMYSIKLNGLLILLKIYIIAYITENRKNFTTC